ncbi:hypothetical protein ABPG74_003821 [Tetrahymena malaccensis]
MKTIKLLVTISIYLFILIGFLRYYSHHNLQVERDLTFTTIPTGEDARCLDGSFPGYYYSEGITNNTLIYLIGMGNCAASTVEEILENCYQRSFTEIGSNIDRPEKLPSELIQGVFSGENPIFGDWNVVIVPACDGGVYIGDKTVTYKEKQLYFRGQGLMKAIINDLVQNKGLDQNKNVVLSGGSAGALGTYQYSNYLQKVLKNSQIKAIPDSGYFLDQPESFHQTLQTFGQFLKNEDYATIFPECLYQYGEDQDFYKCILPEYSWKYINVDTFIVGSLYDIWQYYSIYQFKCAKDFNNCDQETINFMNLLKDEEYNQVSAILKQKTNWGAWLVSCPFHGIIQSDYIYDPKLSIPSGSQFTIWYSVQAWFEGKTGSLVQRLDRENWPNNSGCANIFFD